MQLKMYRCRICGDTYLGYEPPANCPFCGAHVEFMRPTQEYPADINKVQLTESERVDLDASIELELSNTRFYLGMAERKDNDLLSSAYKRLAKVEAEHCGLFCKLAGVPKPVDLSQPGETTGSWLSDIEESLTRENRASALYTTFAGRATSERLKEVWQAVSAVEADHITLDEIAKDHV
ncbi:MAG: ferritin [Coriobacteriia bacterium]|nr:ferritin [Coriobacteriia bacterium]